MNSSAANVLEAYWPLVLTTSQVEANTRTHAQELWTIQPLPTAPQSRRRGLPSAMTVTVTSRRGTRPSQRLETKMVSGCLPEQTTPLHC